MFYLVIQTKLKDQFQLFSYRLWAKKNLTILLQKLQLSHFFLKWLRVIGLSQSGCNVECWKAPNKHAALVPFTTNLQSIQMKTYWNANHLNSNVGNNCFFKGTSAESLQVTLAQQCFKLNVNIYMLRCSKCNSWMQMFSRHNCLSWTPYYCSLAC